MALCWMCREKMYSHFSPEYWKKFLADHPSIHCHHEEPEEKPKKKCWCDYPEDSRDVEVSLTTMEWQIYKPEYCPGCGKKL